LESQLKDYVLRFNLGQYIKFVGQQDDIYRFYSSIDVLVLPSISNEDFPNVILEAMSVGKAVIGTNLAGISEQIVDGFNGILVSPKSTEELKNAIKAFCNNPQLVKKFGEAGKIRFEEFFTAEIAGNNYFNFYNQLLNIKKLN
jgi:glycosyltransferase involved in cell wall biosynthesis